MNRPEREELFDLAEHWQTQDSADSFEDSEPVDFDVDLRRNLLHPKLVVLSHRPEKCPSCRSQLDDVSIEYVTWSDGRILVMRDVPALRCRASGHEFLVEGTLDRLEHLIELEGMHQVEPEEMLNVPVFSLRKTAA